MEEVVLLLNVNIANEENDEELRKAIHDACYERYTLIAASGNRKKHERQDAFDAIREEFKAQYTEEELEEKSSVNRPLLSRCRKRGNASLHS